MAMPPGEMPLFCISSVHSSAAPSSSIWAFAHTRVFSYTAGLADALAASAAFRRTCLSKKVCVWCCLALFCLLVMVPKERGRDFAAGCGVCVYGVRTVGIFL